MPTATGSAGPRVARARPRARAACLRVISFSGERPPITLVVMHDLLEALGRHRPAREHALQERPHLVHAAPGRRSAISNTASWRGRSSPRARLVHVVDQRLDLIDRRAREDAVAEVEDVARAPAGLVEHALRARCSTARGASSEPGSRLPMHRHVVRRARATARRAPRASRCRSRRRPASAISGYSVGCRCRSGSPARSRAASGTAASCAAARSARSRRARARPTQLSKICRACAPASTCACR